MKFTRLFSFIALIALFTACGGGESSDQQQAEQSSGDDVRTIEIVGLNSLKFAVDGPTDGITVGDELGQNNELRQLETITVQPGEEIRIVLTTQSQLPASAMAHNWILLAMDTDAAAFASAAVQAKANEYIPQDMTESVLAKTGLAAGGETSEVTFTAPETPGEYDFICSFPGHFSGGMRGTLVVEG